MQSLIRPNRDLRIDFFRGLALWCMFIDHLILGWLRAITIMRYGFCDSAEVFVLLSGISAGLIYGGISTRQGISAARRRIFSRAGYLYRTQLIMLVVFLAEAGLLYFFLKPPSFLAFNGLDGFAAEPFKHLLSAVVLFYQPRCLNILPLYIVFFLLLGAGLPLVERWPRTVLSLSCGLWMATRLMHLSIPGWPGFFNPLAWQLIFVTGVVAKEILAGKRMWRGWDLLAALFFVFGLLESQAAHLSRLIPAPIWIHLDADRANLHPLRLLSVLAYAWLGWRFIPAAAGWLRSRWATPLVLLGQHSLPVFVVSVFLSMAGQAWLSMHHDARAQIVTQGLGSVALVGLAAWCAWRGRPAEARMPARVVPETGAVS
jgi:hypothetical protein